MRLINQTFAFGCQGWRRWRKRSRRRNRRQRRPGRVEHSTSPSRAKQSQAAPRRAKLQPLFLPLCLTLVVISLARYFCVALTRTLSISLSLSLSLSLALSPTLADYVSCAVFFLRLSVCLPASACRSVGSRFPPVFPSSDSRALSPCLSPGLAMYRWHGESTHQSADCGLLNARSHDPASGDVYTG